MSFISPKHKLAFIHVPKTAGRSMNLLLINHCRPEIEFNTRKLNPEVNVLGRKISLEAKNLTTPEIWDSCYKFAFVRNPWDRLYLYLNI